MHARGSLRCVLCEVMMKVWESWLIREMRDRKAICGSVRKCENCLVC